MNTFIFWINELLLAFQTATKTDWEVHAQLQTLLRKLKKTSTVVDSM